MADRDVTVQFKGDRRQLGAAAKQAEQDIEQVKKSAEKLGRDLGNEIGKGFRGLGTLIGLELRKQIIENAAIATQAALLNTSPALIRGGKAAFGRIGVEDAFEPSLAAVAKAKAEAEAGGDEAAAAFRRYGVDFSLPLEQVFERLLVNLRELEPTTSDVGPLRTLLGGEAEKALFAAQNRAGFALDREDSKARFFAYRMFDIADATMKYFLGSGIFATTKPGSILPDKTAEQERADQKAAEDRSKSEAKSRRELMTLDERILSIRKEIEATQRRISEETDPVRRRQLEKDVVGLENEQRTAERELMGASRRPSSSRVDVDEFAQRGLFIGGTPRVQVLQEQQLDQLRQAVSELRSLRNDQKGLW